jgi:prepilin-type N-terminal cleavage/methylation domain-containing protein
MSRRARRAHVEVRPVAGFTLVELLITVTVLPVVLGALAFGFVSILALQSSVSNRLSDSGDAQVVSSAFQTDVQSATWITNHASSSPSCGSSGTQLLGLGWTLSNGTAVVSYSQVGSLLVRTYCTSPSMSPSGVLTPAESNTLVTSLAGVQSAAVVSVVSGGVSAPPCNATLHSDWTSSSPDWVCAQAVPTVTFPVVDVHSNPVTNFTISLVATPRVFDKAPAGGQGGQPFAPFTLLNTSASCPQTNATASLTMTAGATVNIDGGSGPIAVNSSCAGAVYEQSAGTSLNASPLTSNNPNGDSLTLVAGASGPSTQTLSSQPLSDPFVSLNAPTLASPATIAAMPLGSCTGTSPVTCSPGYYNSSGTYSNSSGNVIFTGGTYVFKFAVNLQGQTGRSFTFGPGNYLFQGGLTIAANATANFGTGTYICEGATSLSVASNATVVGTQVLFYIPPASSPTFGGAVSFTSNSSVSLTGIASYLGVTLWDAAASGTSNPFTMGSNVSASGVGGIYVPNGEVVDASGGTVTATFIVSNTAAFQGGGTVVSLTGS